MSGRKRRNLDSTQNLPSIRSPCPVGSSPWNGSSLRTGRKYPGAHASAAGGVQNAVANALTMEAHSFALFLKPQRQWKAKPLGEDVARQFRASLQAANIPVDLVLPHGSYLLNLGSPKEEVRLKSRECFLEELQRCERLGLKLYNFHPGSSLGQITRADCIELIAEEINYAHSQTRSVKIVLENMSKQGHTIGGDLTELRAIIDRVKAKDRIGVCLDTCHAMAAGYDLSTKEGFHAMMQDFGEIIGFQYLMAVHLNDSKGEVGCHKDRHASIGQGTIGLAGFSRIMNDPHFNDIPMILETPFEGNQTYLDEIRLLQGLIINTE